MSKNIIDNISRLIDMSRDELDEILLDEKYNKANLRELIRRLIPELRNYRNLFLADYEGKIPGELSEFIMSVEAIGGVEDYYLHRNWIDGSLELNIGFNDSANKILEDADIKEINSIAIWE